MTTDEKVMARIVQLCKERRITVNKLATMSDIAQSTLSDIVHGKSRTITIRTIERICRGLGISVFEFFDIDSFRE